MLPMAPTAQAIRASNSNIPEGRSNGVVPCFPHPSGMILWWHSRLLLTSRRLWVAPWGQGGTGCCMLRCICHPQRLMDSCTCHWPLRQIAQHTLQQQADSAIGEYQQYAGLTLLAAHVFGLGAWLCHYPQLKQRQTLKRKCDQCPLPLKQ